MAHPQDSDPFKDRSSTYLDNREPNVDIDRAERICLDSIQTSLQHRAAYVTALPCLPARQNKRTPLYAAHVSCLPSGDCSETGSAPLVETLTRRPDCRNGP